MAARSDRARSLPPHGGTPECVSPHAGRARLTRASSTSTPINWRLWWASRPAQLRRDLASFGSFGNIARGYDVHSMSPDHQRDHRHRRACRTSRSSGVGDLGRALLSYRGFEERGFHIVADLRRRSGQGWTSVRRPPLPRPRRTRDSYLTDHGRPHDHPGRASRRSAVARRPGRGHWCAWFPELRPQADVRPKGCFVEPIDISAKLEKLSFLCRQEGEAQVEDQVFFLRMYCESSSL